MKTDKKEKIYCRNSQSIYVHKTVKTITLDVRLGTDYSLLNPIKFRHGHKLPHFPIPATSSPHTRYENKLVCCKGMIIWKLIQKLFKLSKIL